MRIIIDNTVRFFMDLTNTTTSDGSSVKTSFVATIANSPSVIATANTDDFTGTAMHGSVVVDGSDIVYTPDTNYTGSDIINYSLGGNKYMVYIYVQPEQIDTTADFIVTHTNETATIPVLSNDEDNLVVESISNPSHGSAIVRDNNILYTPSSDYTGSDMLTYTVKTPTGNTSTQVVYIQVMPSYCACKRHKVAINFNTPAQPIVIIPDGNILTTIHNLSDVNVNLAIDTRRVIITPSNSYRITCDDYPYVRGNVIGMD